MEQPNPEVFTALLTGDIKKLWLVPREKLRPYLPYLCRVTARNFPAIDNNGTSSGGSKRRRALCSLLCEFEDTNTIECYLKLNFSELRHDALKEQQLLKKLRPGEKRGLGESILAASVKLGLATEFERSEPVRRVRLVLSEVLRYISQLQTSFRLDQSDLFECTVFLEEIGDVLAIVAAELPSLLPIAQLVEALLRCRTGSHLITRLVANMPNCFDKVVTTLVTNGEALDEISQAGRVRSKAIQSLIAMNRSRASYVQWLACQHQKLPTLMIFIALDTEKQKEERLCESHKGEPQFGGVLSLMSNIVIHGSEGTRSWFAQYMKLMQQKYRRHRSSAVNALRKFLMKNLVFFIGLNKVPAAAPPSGGASVITSSSVVEMETETHTSGIGMGIPHERQISEEAVEVGVSGGVADEEDVVDGEELMAATLELMGQMDIEISDQEGVASVVDMASGGGTSNGDGGIPVVAAPTVSDKPENVDGKTHRRRRHSSISLAMVDFPSISMQCQLTDDVIVELTRLLHVCCGLKVQAHMYLTGEETAALLHLITCTFPPFSSAGVKFVEVALCVLLACPFLLSSGECGEQAVVRWLSWLLDNLSDFERACPGERCYGEMLLLVALHLQDRQLNQIEELITSVLKMKTPASLRTGHFTALREQFLKVFTEDVVCAHAMSVPPTPSLSGHMTGYLPLHCVHQLMKSRAFRKHGVSVKDWVYQQLCTTAEPLHSSLPPLVQEYVQAVLSTHSSVRPLKNSSQAISCQVPLTAEEVLSVFQWPSDSSLSLGTAPFPLSSQLLMLYYILYYQDTYLTNLKTLLQSSVSSAPPRAYSPSVLVQLPVKKLLQHAWKHQETYSTLYPPLLKLTISQLPHLCLTEDWIKQEDAGSGPVFRLGLSIHTKRVTTKLATEILSNLRTSSSQALLLLTHLSSLPPPSLVLFSPVLTSTLPLLLERGISKRLQQLYLLLWTELNSIIPRRLWVETVNALRPAHLQALPPYSHQMLIEDPIIVLQCNTGVFRCPPVFEIVLRVLAAYTSSSRVWLLNQAHSQSCQAAASHDSTGTQLSHQEREELRIALTAAQESAIIQLLLEVCLPQEDDRKAALFLGSQLTALQEMQCLVCSYLHQVFIAEPSMVKLIHFQGYPAQLLPMMVAGVPSMHICHDFIGEMLSQSLLEKQLFAVQLATQVTHHYPLPESMGTASDIIRRLGRLTTEVPVDKRSLVFKPLLPCVVSLCQTFPPICVEGTEFLLQLGRVCLSSQPSSLHQHIKISHDGGSSDLMHSIDAESTDPVIAMEDRMAKLAKLSLVEAVQWAFGQLIRLAVLRVSAR